MSKQKQSIKDAAESEKQEEKLQERAKEIGGFEKKLEPTRYGDWDVNGRCSDF